MCVTWSKGRLSENIQNMIAPMDHMSAVVEYPTPTHRDREALMRDTVRQTDPHFGYHNELYTCARRNMQAR